MTYEELIHIISNMESDDDIVDIIRDAFDIPLGEPWDNGVNRRERQASLQIAISCFIVPALRRRGYGFRYHTIARLLGIKKNGISSFMASALIKLRKMRTIKEIAKRKLYNIDNIYNGNITQSISQK